MFDIRVASLDDLSALQALHRKAFAGSMGVALGPAYIRAFLRRFISDPDAIALVATDQVVLHGYCLGAPVADTRPSRQLLTWAAFGALTHPWLLLRSQIRAEARRRMKRRGTPEERRTAGYLPEPTMSLVGIGTEPASRQRGIGGALLSRFEAAALQRGAASLRLSVYKDNEAARHLYETAGWRCFEHPTNPDVVYYGRLTA